ncbi:MAG: MTH1187 family thiamine-binding protein [Desulfovibrionales bacterium]
MSVIVDLSIFPMDKGMSVSKYVARSVELITSSGVKYKVGPMGTSMEGDWDQVMNVVSRCLNDMQRDCDRVYMTLKVDARKGDEPRLEEKVASVEKRQDWVPPKES